jgi:hypothetical protein
VVPAVSALFWLFALLAIGTCVWVILAGGWDD